MSEDRRTVVDQSAGVWGFFFFLAYIGAAIYFIAHSGGGFWPVVLGLLQAAVWPVYLVYAVFEALAV